MLTPSALLLRGNFLDVSTFAGAVVQRVTLSASAASGGLAISAAAVGVGARTSAAKSAMVKSVS